MDREKIEEKTMTKKPMIIKGIAKKTKKGIVMTVLGVKSFGRKIRRKMK